MNKNVKKYFVIIPITILIFLALHVGINSAFDNVLGYKKFKIADFDEYRADFQIVVDEIFNFNNSNDNNIVLADLVSANGVSQLIILEKDKEIEIPLTTDAKKALGNIYKIFYNHGVSFNRVCFDNDRITFCSEENWYAVSYSISGKKPQYMSLPTERFTIEVQGIDKNWFHIFDKSLK